MCEYTLSSLGKKGVGSDVSHERYKLILEGAGDYLWDWDIEKDTAYISERWKQDIGFSEQEVDNYYKTYKNTIHPKDVGTVVDKLNLYLAGKIPNYENEYRIRLNSGKYIWILSRGKALWDPEGRAVRMAGSHADITERKKVESRLIHLAYHDPLTDVLIRTAFVNRLKSAVTEAKIRKLKVAVLFIDIDNFKTINDNYGHQAGDRFLKIAARNLQSCIRECDTLSRIGGDEFAILLPALDSTSDVKHVTDRIFSVFQKPFFINGHKLENTLSIGAAVYPVHGGSGKSLLKKADIAMYSAKENGKNNLQFFNTHLFRKIKARSDIGRDLRTALDSQEIYLTYQPIIELKNKKIVCLEALLRWKHPKLGIVSPECFVPAAEESGMILPIGEWVLNNACAQLKKLNDMGFVGCGMSVNVSPIQLQHPYFAEIVSNVVRSSGLMPGRLILEITESKSIISNHTAEKNLKKLKKQGVKLSIDDFCTGFCSLEYLQRYSINSLKVDRRFITDIHAKANKAIVEMIITLGHRLDMPIIAEGVETKEQYEYLVSIGCDMIQGFYLNKPVKPEAIPGLLEVDR